MIKTKDVQQYRAFRDSIELTKTVRKVGIRENENGCSAIVIDSKTHKEYIIIGLGIENGKISVIENRDYTKRYTNKPKEYTYKEALKKFTFENGSPFGIKVKE